MIYNTTRHKNLFPHAWSRTRRFCRSFALGTDWLGKSRPCSLNCSKSSSQPLQLLIVLLRCSLATPSILCSRVLFHTPILSIIPIVTRANTADLIHPVIHCNAHPTLSTPHPHPPSPKPCYKLITPPLRPRLLGRRTPLRERPVRVAALVRHRRWLPGCQRARTLPHTISSKEPRATKRSRDNSRLRSRNCRRVSRWPARLWRRSP